MCYDVSFAARFNSIVQRFPGIEVDPFLQGEGDFLLHVQAQAHRKYPVVVFSDAHYKLKPFEWA